MDETIAVLPEAPICCLEDDPTPCFAEEIPAPSRDPPPKAPKGPKAPKPPRTLAGLEPMAIALKAYGPLALAIVRRHGVPARDAPDVVQDLLITLLPRWAEREKWAPEKRTSYVAGAARVAARRYLGRSARKAEVLVSGAALQAIQERAAREGAESDTAEDPLLAQELGEEHAPDAWIDFLQASMRPAFWRVFAAYVLLGVPTAVIARREKAPLGTIYNRLRLARRNIVAALERAHARHVGPFRAPRDRRVQKVGTASFGDRLAALLRLFS